MIKNKLHLTENKSHFDIRELASQLLKLCIQMKQLK